MIRPENRKILCAAGIFAGLALLLHAWRSHVLLASYDQGIFQQVLWNSLQGHPFESTLSSQLSTNVIHAGHPPSVDYERLGQHFTPTLLLWAPLFACIGPAALPLVQVGLITAAGLVLHRIASGVMKPAMANWIGYGYFAGQALIGPTLGNFTDLCQLPLAVFTLMLGLIERRRWLIAISALLIPLIREDTGVLLVAIGIWLLIRERERWALALVLMLWGGGWVLICTNVLMPLFSDDNAKRFMVENFGQYLESDGVQSSSSLGLIQQALQQPLLLLKELIDPPGQTVLYLLGHALPFLFVPLISIDAWLLAGPSLLGLFLAQGANDPLSITIRYTLLVVPGFAMGTVFWWARRDRSEPGPRLRGIWRSCLVLSLVLAFSSNPHRSLSALVPDSIDPWVHSTAVEQWQHGHAARSVLGVIPADATVSANTHLVPLLARREVLVRFPFDTTYLDRQGVRQPVTWIAVDLDMLRRYGAAFGGDWKQLRNSQNWLNEERSLYAVQAFKDGVVALERAGARNPTLEATLDQELAKPLPRDPRQRHKSVR
ncbi:DUF2079 domain-containing protein [Synechococcus sp. MIT S1220]|uniref:DUF2079 domain-containing protein n=1 Tax=Synechococcus sp. MIT S1220 TaxID=3082549 RepID=UPI0039AEB6D1